jgi:hypothetical protein
MLFMLCIGLPPTSQLLIVKKKIMYDFTEVFICLFALPIYYKVLFDSR